MGLLAFLLIICIYYGQYAVVAYFMSIGILVLHEFKIYKAFQSFHKKADSPLVLTEWKPIYIEKTKQKMDEVKEILKPYLKPFKG